MLSWSFEFEDKDYFEGFRSLATNGIDKPVLNVFRMFGMMGGSRVASTSTGQVPLDTMLSGGVRQAADVDALATRADREAAVLVWNYHDSDAPAGETPTTITVAGIPAGVRRVSAASTTGSTRPTATPIPCGRQWARPQQPTTQQDADLQAAGAAYARDLPGMAGRA